MMKHKKVKMEKLEKGMDKVHSLQNEIPVSGLLHRLLEINRQLVALFREQERLIQSILPYSESELFFDDHHRRIYWDGGSVRLGTKAFLLVKTIWLGEQHKAKFSEMKENVWGRHIESRGFIIPPTVSSLIHCTQKNLTMANFPYKIESVKNRSTRTLEGFRLVLMHGQKIIGPSE